jgi:O-antigen/teichoic acid export membrane protein
MIGLAVMAKQVVLLVLGEKWLPCVPFVQIYCCMYLFYPIHTTNLSAIKAIGRSDIFLKLEIIKKICGISLLVGSYFYFRTPIGIAYGALASAILSSFINASPNLRLLNYGYVEQIKDIFPAFALVVPMGAAVYAVNLIGCPLLLEIALQVITGVIVYFGLAKLFNLERFNYIVTTIQNYKKK